MKPFTTYFSKDSKINDYNKLLSRQRILFYFFLFLGRPGGLSACSPLVCGGKN